MFIVFEGADGCGKTTQSGLLSKWLGTCNIDHLLTKEPGTILSKECQQIRHLLLSPDNKLSEKAELLLYLADRAQHVDRCIRPALNENKWVISDRYSLSTFVYQGFGRNLLHTMGSDLFTSMLKYASDHLVPDITFVIDVPVEISLQRAKHSNKEFIGGDRIEREAFEFHQLLHKKFMEMANSTNCVILDGTKDIDSLHNEIITVIEAWRKK